MDQKLSWDCVWGAPWSEYRRKGCRTYTSLLSSANPFRRRLWSLVTHSPTLKMAK